MNVLEKLKLKRTARTQKAAAKWDDLVRQAAGDKADVDTIDAALTQIGRTPDDLAAAVELFHQVEAARLKCQGTPALRTKLQTVNEQMQQLRDGTEKQVVELQNQCRADVNAMQAEAIQIQLRLNEAEDAWRFLLQQPKPDDMRAQLDELARQKSELRASIEQHKVAKSLGNVTGRVHPRELNAHTQQIEALESQIKAICDKESKLELSVIES